MWKLTPLKIVFVLFLPISTFAIALDVLMPAIPQIQVHFNSTQSNTSLILSIFYLAYGLGHLFVGPIADNIGRYKLILISIFALLITSTLAIISPSLQIIILYRIVQGIVCSGLTVSCFAIIKDSFSNQKITKIYSLITAFSAISPILFPSIGVVLVAIWG